MKELLILMVIPLIFSLASVILLIPDYRYYKKVYKNLKSMTFYLNIDQVYGCSYRDYRERYEFIWFLDTNSFKLGRNHYLHNVFYTYLDPYALYWLLKYKRWVKKNIDINKIKKY